MKFSNNTYKQVVDGLLQNEQLDDIVLKEFCDKYLNTYYDLQYYFLLNATYSSFYNFNNSRNCVQHHSSPSVQQHLHTILSSLLPLLPSDDTIPEIFTPLPKTTSILLPSSYKVAFQSVWLAHLRHPLEPAQLKQLLLIIHKRIIPYMNKPQMLMDWLTDSYNSGCSIISRLLMNRWKHLSISTKWTMGINAKT